jgi:hypothetical protein
MNVLYSYTCSHTHIEAIKLTVELDTVDVKSHTYLKLS